jgi:hypothetical protein
VKARVSIHQRTQQMFCLAEVDKLYVGLKSKQLLLVRQVFIISRSQVLAITNPWIISSSRNIVIIITSKPLIESLHLKPCVSLIKEDHKAAHNHEHDWYISFIPLQSRTLYLQVVILFLPRSATPHWPLHRWPGRVSLRRLYKDSLEVIATR